MSRLMAEPEAIEVAVAGGVPRLLRGKEGKRRVERVFARWRVESDWWRSAVSREYWKVQLSAGLDDLAGEDALGLVCEVYEDRISGGWWRSRIYD